MTTPEPAGGTEELFDAAILGDTLSAGLVACILARRGLRVAVVGDAPGSEKAVEPTIPHSSVLFELLAARHGIGEIGHLGRRKLLAERVRQPLSINDRIGFVYHRRDRPADAGEPLEFVVPGEHSESHLHSHTCAAYLLATAGRLGARVLTESSPVTVERDGERVVVVTDSGQRLRARCCVDATGGGEAVRPLLGEQPAADDEKRPTTVVRVEAEGIARYEDSVERRQPPWSAGTLHHVFDRGWVRLAVARPDPDPLRTRYAVTVGLREDAWSLQHPEDALSVAVKAFPALERQFADVAPRQDPVPTEAAPTRPARSIADAVCVLGPSPVETEPWFGWPLIRAAVAAEETARCIRSAVRRDDFSSASFEPVQEVQEGLAAYHETVVEAAYAASRDFSLWNAFARVWLLGSMLGTIPLQQEEKRRRKNKIPARQEASDEPGWWASRHEGYLDMWAETVARCAAVDRGEVPAGEAAGEIFSLLATERFVPPVFDFGDPDSRRYKLSAGRQVRTMLWLLTRAPDDIKAIAK